MKRMAATLAGFLAGWLLASSSPGGDPEKRLEAAIHREIVLGDLRGAAEQFRGLLNPPAGSRTVAARALLHLGQCMEKSGQKDEARRLYAR